MTFLRNFKSYEKNSYVQFVQSVLFWCGVILQIHDQRMQAIFSSERWEILGLKLTVDKDVDNVPWSCTKREFKPKISQRSELNVACIRRPCIWSIIPHQNSTDWTNCTYNFFHRTWNFLRMSFVHSILQINRCLNWIMAWFLTSRTRATYPRDLKRAQGKPRR